MSQELIRERLPLHRRPADENAKKQAVLHGQELHGDDEPVWYKTNVGFVLVAKCPFGIDHAVCRPTLEECADHIGNILKDDFLRRMRFSEETKHEDVTEPTLNPDAPDDDRDRGGLPGDSAGVHAAGEDRADGGGGGADDLRPVEAIQPETGGPGGDETADAGPKLVAVEWEERPTLEMRVAEMMSQPVPDDALSGGKDYAGGMMLEKDEIARRVRELSIDIAYAKTDRMDGAQKAIDGLAAEYQKLFAEGQITGQSDFDRMNAIQSEQADLILRRTKIEATAKSLIDALPGKSLDYLRQFDVADPGLWPT